MIEPTAPVVKEHQVFKDARGRCGGASCTWLLVAPLVEVVSLAERLEIGAVTVEVEANVRDIFLKERELGVWISHVSGNTKRILVAIRQASFLCLSAHRLGP